MSVAKLTPRALLLVALFACVALASIEREPVKVTHRNSGPRYDIDDVERTRLGAENPESNQVPTGPSRNEQQDGNENNQDPPMVSIRRIFVVPMMTSSSSGDDSERSQMSDPMSMFSGPPRPSFWPFRTLHPSRHLFGADDASRPSATGPMESDDREKQDAAASGEREGPNSNERPVRPPALLDPIEMLMEAMRQALNPDNMLTWPPKTPSETDLNKEASGDNKPMGDTALERPSKPQTFNETKEDIVEIEGKKYVRKTVINRHVGDGIMFMTRRLIFSPLNETDSEAPSTTSTTTTTTTTTQAPVPENKEATTTTTIAPPAEQPAFGDKTDEPSTSSVKPAASEPSSTTVEPVATEVPSKPASDAEPNSPTTTVASNVEETTKAESAADRVSEILHKVERLMEKEETERKEVSSTVKPNESS